MEFLAFASFAALIVAWLFAPSRKITAITEERAAAWAARSVTMHRGPTSGGPRC